MTNLNTIFAQIATLSMDDQRMLNKMLVNNINTQIKEKQRTSAFQFRIGDIVVFDAGLKGGLTTMRIEKFSRDLTKIKGHQLAGKATPNTFWTIPATLAKKV